MTVDPAGFRAVLGQWPTGVAVVTTVTGSGRHGMTASSFASVSLDPPLVSVCIAGGTPSHDRIVEAGCFAVNILGKDHVEIGKRFAGGRTGADRFEGLEPLTAKTGSPLLADAVGWVDCTLFAAHSAGDHTIFVGEVLAAAVPRPTAPLLYHSRAWGQLADVLPETAGIVDTGTLTDAAGASDETLELVLASHPDRVRIPAGCSADWLSGITTSLLAESAEAVFAAAGAGVAMVEVTDPGLLEAVRQCGLAARLIIPNGFRRTDALSVVAEAVAAAADEICLAGPASPRELRMTLQEVVGRTARSVLAVSIDNDRLGMANALTALKSGVSRLDVAVGGAGGRLPTADVLHLYEVMGIARQSVAVAG